MFLYLPSIQKAFQFHALFFWSKLLHHGPKTNTFTALQVRLSNVFHIFICIFCSLRFKL